MNKGTPAQVQANKLDDTTHGAMIRTVAVGNKYQFCILHYILLSMEEEEGTYNILTRSRFYVLVAL